MKTYKITNLFFSLCFVLAFASCVSDDDLLAIRATDFTKAELMKLHGGSDKSWKLTEIIIPKEFRDDPAFMNTTCVADDIYTFSVPTSELYESTIEVNIELGDVRCFETYSDAESFEGKLLYYLNSAKLYSFF